MTIGIRLKEERERLGFSQTAFAGVGNTTKKSQIDYEKDLTHPKSIYLSAIAKLGADVLYIVTGERCASAMTSDEKELIELFRAAPLVLKAAVIGTLHGGSSVLPSGHSSGPTVLIGDVSSGQGGVTIGGIMNSALSALRDR